MPDPYTHYAFGKAVEELLSPAVRSRLIPSVFHRGLTGPDPWSTVGFWGAKRKRFAYRSAAMHESRGCAFLLALAQEVSRDENNALFSYFAGFLCHVVLDGKAHPYIMYRGGFDNGKAGHLRLERAIDCHYLRRDYQKAPWKTAYPKDTMKEKLPLTVKAGLDRAYEKAYGWKNAFDAFQKALGDEALFYRLMLDPTGICSVLLRLLGKGGAYTYFSYYKRELSSERLDFLNRKESVWYHPFEPAGKENASFEEIFSSAAEEASRLIASFCEKGELFLTPWPEGLNFALGIASEGVPSQSPVTDPWF